MFAGLSAVDGDAAMLPESASAVACASGATGIAAGGNALIPGMQEAGAVNKGFSSPAVAPTLGIDVGGAGIAMALQSPAAR